MGSSENTTNDNQSDHSGICIELLWDLTRLEYPLCSGDPSALEDAQRLIKTAAEKLKSS